MSWPANMGIGVGVRMRKCIQGGVSDSRLVASLKNAKTRSIGWGSQTSR